MKLFLCNRIVFDIFATFLKKPDLDEYLDITLNVFDALVEVINCSSANDSIEDVVTIFEETGLKDMVDQLCGHYHQKINKQAAYILDLFEKDMSDDIYW